MKDFRNLRNYFRTTAKQFLSLFSVGIVTVVVISRVAIAQSPSATGPNPAKADAATEDKAIRPFKFSASKEALADMRKRIAATKWPSRELVKRPAASPVYGEKLTHCGAIAGRCALKMYF